MANVNKRVSIVWDHFVDIGGYYATCNICKAKLSFKSSVTNLKKHVDKKHLAVRMVSRTDASTVSSHLNSQLIGEATSAGSSLQLPLPSSTLTLDAPLQPATSQTVQPLVRRTYGHQPISNFVSRRGNSKFEIDNKIMNLFTKDFQPFRIVEDRGFRELIAYAFPHYTIPTRKFFANNMLPAMFEKAKADLKEHVSKHVKSVCVTVDIWTSRANDSLLAVTGHFIEEEEFNLKSILLDCVPLLESHTAKNIADCIKQICDEWCVTDKILLAVSDNGANIKSAIERELRWKHFACYIHTLNLSVTDTLKEQAVTDLISKIKGVVRHFKQSNLAWEKLKKYQEQGGATPKRLLQDVPTRWNSTFYMLQRCVELKEPLNSAMVNLGLNAITGYEWFICEELCLILQPCEEVTRELSGQKYITGSLVIPITIGLIKALEKLGIQRHFLPVVDKLRQDLIGNLKNRFLNLNRSKTFGYCLFLDPRFKFYFSDPIIADDIKRRIISLLTTQQRIVVEDDPTPTTQPSVSSETKSIWQDFDEKMSGIQPEGTAQSRAIVEVQRYHDDKIIARTDCPLKWWREHRNIYPNLYKIAATKLNAMASSVPCERVFSAAGNILNDRRTRLGVRKLQQLVFLQQNSL